MAAAGHLSDAELRVRLRELGFPTMPVTHTTRKVLLKKLAELRENKYEAASGNSVFPCRQLDEVRSNRDIVKQQRNWEVAMDRAPILSLNQLGITTRKVDFSRPHIPATGMDYETNQGNRYWFSQANTGFGTSREFQFFNDSLLDDHLSNSNYLRPATIPSSNSNASTLPTNFSPYLSGCNASGPLTKECARSNPSKGNSSETIEPCMEAKPQQPISPLQPAKQEERGTLCIICKDQPPTTLLIPCNHFGYCDACSKEMQARSLAKEKPDEVWGYNVDYSVCPLDRIKIKQYIRVVPT